MSPVPRLASKLPITGDGMQERCLGLPLNLRVCREFSFCNRWHFHESGRACSVRHPTRKRIVEGRWGIMVDDDDEDA